jgi:hypothetical protein
MESHVDPDATEVREADVRRVERGIKAGRPREHVFPKLASVGSDISGSGLTVTVKMVKSEGLPITYTSGDSNAESAAIRLVDVEKKFYMGAFNLADRYEIPRHKATSVRRHLGLDANDDVNSHRFVFGSQKHMRYSDNALMKMKKARQEYDLDEIWTAHKTPSRGKTRPACSQPGCAEATKWPL